MTDLPAASLAGSLTATGGPEAPHALPVSRRDDTGRHGVPADLLDAVAAHADELNPSLVALRRDLHAHPELGRAELRTTRLVRERLEEAGLAPRVLPGGTGLVVDVVPRGWESHRHEPNADVPRLALRADIDALPIADAKDVPYRSQVPGVCHACGHDVHTASLVGAAVVLARLADAGRLPAPVRLVFQPAEELMPGGALDVVRAGALTGVTRILAVHCDPRLEVGRIGLRTGAITAAADHVFVRMSGPGGHTARPHLTADVIHALASVASDLPAALSRRVDPRAGMSVVWGRIAAGSAPNAVPSSGELQGTLRCLDVRSWELAPKLVDELVRALAQPYGVDVEIEHVRGVPPVDNTPSAVEHLQRAARAALGADAVTATEQSLGGEDFAWYLQQTDGALARLGVGPPGVEADRHARDLRAHDLHQGGFDVHEDALGVAVRVFATAALLPVGAARADGPA